MLTTSTSQYPHSILANTAAPKPVPSLGESITATSNLLDELVSLIGKLRSSISGPAPADDIPRDLQREGGLRDTANATRNQAELALKLLGQIGADII